MDLRQIRYFIAVAEEGRIARAAERLGMQQPPLSQQIKAIEREMDVQLFRRRPRGVELTDAGRAFLENARATLAHLDHTVEPRGVQRGASRAVSVWASRRPLHFTRSFRAPFVPFAKLFRWCRCGWRSV
jgi:DNA-binding transcriptional LysR family regulator